MKIFHEHNKYPGTTARKTATPEASSTSIDSHEHHHSNLKSDKSRTSSGSSKPVVGPTPAPKSTRVVSAPTRVMLLMVILTSLVMSYCTTPPIPNRVFPEMVKRGSGWKISPTWNGTTGRAAESGRKTQGRGQHAAVKMNQRNAVELRIPSMQLDTLEPKGTDTQAHHRSGISGGSLVRIPAGCLLPPLTQTSESKLGNPHCALASTIGGGEQDIRKPMSGKAPVQANALSNFGDMLIYRSRHIINQH